MRRLAAGEELGGVSKLPGETSFAPVQGDKVCQCDRLHDNRNPFIGTAKSVSCHDVNIGSETNTAVPKTCSDIIRMDLLIVVGVNNRLVFAQ